MASPLDGPGLVHLFEDFQLLPALLQLGSEPDRPPLSWATQIQTADIDTSHANDLRMTDHDLFAYIVVDAWQLARKLKLFDPGAENGLTDEGVEIASFSGESGPELRDLGDALGAQISRHYRDAKSVSIVRRLHHAISFVAALKPKWNVYAPGLLLAEFQFLLSALVHGLLPWRTILGRLEEIRRVATRRLGAPSPRRVHNIVDFSDAVTALHWEAADRAAQPRMTLIEAKANAKLFVFSNLLHLGSPMGPVQHLALPTPAVPRLAQSPQRGVMLIGDEEPVEWLPHVEVEEAITLLYQTAEEDVLADARIARRLGIDRRTRKDTGNPLPLGKKKTDADTLDENPDTDTLHNTRWMNPALAMELLATSALSAIDLPDWVRCFCRLSPHGAPNTFAPPKKFDVVASYPASGRTPGFAVAVEVSAREYSMLSLQDYKQQLTQGVTHAIEMLNEAGHSFSKIYVLVANVRDPCVEGKIWDTYKEVVAETKIESNERIELVPMYTKDLAFAAERINDAYWDARGKFGPGELARVLDEHVALLNKDEMPDKPESMREIWQRAEDPLRFGGVLLDPPEPDPPKPRSSADPSPS